MLGPADQIMCLSEKACFCLISITFLRPKMCSAFNASKASIKVNFDAICQEENSMTVANANGLATIPTKVTKPIEMIKVIVIS